MCLNVKVGLLEKREDWQEHLRELFASDKEQEYVSIVSTFQCRNVLSETYIVLRNKKLHFKCFKFALNRTHRKKKTKTLQNT
jgi:PIN domain nuclease of toxin-antitoxin system